MKKRHKFTLADPMPIVKEQLDVLLDILDGWVIETDSIWRVVQLEHSNLYVISSAIDELYASNINTFYPNEL